MSMLAKGAVARTGIRFYPISLTYEVTHRCNLACIYCDRHTPLPNEMKRQEIFRALEQFYNLGMRSASLDGGDPLVHQDIDEIVEWLTQRGIQVVMNSNGILVPKKIPTVKKLALIKISLDGPPAKHDAMRGPGSFEKAVAGAVAARDAGVKVEFTCTVGKHNVDCLDVLIDVVDDLGLSIIFQPVMNSLFLNTQRDGSLFQPDIYSLRAAFLGIEMRKKRSKAIVNGWASLRHFRTFPEDTRLPCCAGRAIAAMDPEGILFQCPQVNRRDRSNSVVRLGAAAAFANLPRKACCQCWCARLVEGNYAWGCRFDRMLPPWKRPR